MISGADLFWLWVTIVTAQLFVGFFWDEWDKQE